MKSIVTALFLICSTLLASAQTQPDRVLVLTKASAEYVDDKANEFVQQLDLRPSAGKEELVCLRTHAYYCGTSYTDLWFSPPSAADPEALALLKKADICNLDPVSFQHAVTTSMRRATTVNGGGGGWTIVAECGGHHSLLEIPDWDGVDAKKLHHASHRAGDLFSFVQFWTKTHSRPESSCPDSWRSSAQQRLPELLDEFHSPALEKSFAYEALQHGRVNQIPKDVFFYDIQVNRSSFENFSEALPQVREAAKVRNLSLDLVALVDGATGKLAGFEKGDLSAEESSFVNGLKRAASSWQFRPNIPNQVPIHVTFQCKQ